MILNPYECKAYIGQTKNAKRRAMLHYQELINGTHKNKELQNEINSKCRFCILQEVKDESKLLLLEKVYMLEMLSNGYGLYNKNPKPTKECILDTILYYIKCDNLVWHNFKKSIGENFGTTPGELKHYIEYHKKINDYESIVIL